jgi:hypothetical protein
MSLRNEIAASVETGTVQPSGAHAVHLPAMAFQVSPWSRTRTNWPGSISRSGLANWARNCWVPVTRSATGRTNAIRSAWGSAVYLPETMRRKQSIK